MGNGQNDFSDFSMMDLFRMELEKAAGALRDGLHSSPVDFSPNKIEPLMRAAHSIKGAARIVGLDGAVTLSSAMEDVFSSAQKSEIVLVGDIITKLCEGLVFFR